MGMEMRGKRKEGMKDVWIGIGWRRVMCKLKGMGKRRKRRENANGLEMRRRRRRRRGIGYRCSSSSSAHARYTRKWQRMRV